MVFTTNLPVLIIADLTSPCKTLFGIVIKVDKESKIDEFTGTIGSGPAYFFYLLKSYEKKLMSICNGDKKIVREIENLVDRLRKEGDSIGAKISVIAKNVPPGLGEPVFDKLDADLAHGLMGINAVKGVEIGKGFEVVSLKGTENRDEISPLGFMSNNSGGTTGGISTGQDIFASIALKPTSSILSSGKSINKSGKSVKVQTKGRHDPCVGLRATPIAEAMVAITLMDHFLRNRAQNSDVKIKLKPIKSRK